MKILLTGATGNVGFETLKKLIERDHEVTVLEIESAKNRKILNQYRDKIFAVFGSVMDAHLIDKLIVDKDVVIHLAAVIPPLADEKPELAKQTNVLGTLNIVNAIEKQSKKPFLMYSSSISVYGDRLENYNIEVGDKLEPSFGDKYAETKIAAENIIQNSSIDYTIFRLGAVMGKPKINPLMFHMPLKTKLEIVSNIDVGEALVKSVNHLGELKGQIFNLGGGEQCRTSYHDFLENMFRIYGLNTKDININAFAPNNFHCGYYIDGHRLNNILNFQNDTLGTYYERMKKEIPNHKRFITRLFSKPILYFMQKKSIFLKHDITTKK
jgi:nucleoside-diphosphate-sugar epimerase